jgi:radical SAM superfamily enzyme YgiQ (UPF0313 family)
MAGFPSETPADIDAIYGLCRALADVRKEVPGARGGVGIGAGVSWLVPKPHTPMQWCAMQTGEYFLDVRRRLKDLSNRSPVTIKFHRVEGSLLEGVLCRGDRRVGAAIEAAWRAGARMDSWDEHFDYAKWTAAFEQTGVDPSFHIHREIPTGELLPWSHIQGHRGAEFLLAEYERMREALLAEK